MEGGDQRVWDVLIADAAPAAGAVGGRAYDGSGLAGRGRSKSVGSSPHRSKPPGLDNCYGGGHYGIFYANEGPDKKSSRHPSRALARPP